MIKARATDKPHCLARWVSGKTGRPRSLNIMHIIGIRSVHLGSGPDGTGRHSDDNASLLHEVRYIFLTATASRRRSHCTNTAPAIDRRSATIIDQRNLTSPSNYRDLKHHHMTVAHPSQVVQSGPNRQSQFRLAGSAS